MEAYRAKFLCFHVGILLSLFYLSHAKAENPLKNVNLSPIWQWRSACECLLNTTDACLPKDVLKLSGVVDVNQTEVTEYCKPTGCRDQTMVVLNCIKMVKRDFRFANKLTVPILTDIITTGCAINQGFTTASVAA